MIRHLHATLFASLAAFTVACPTPARPCSADGDCNAGDVCVIANGAGTCTPAGTPPPVDAGNVVDAGDEPEDAGVVDGGEIVDAGEVDDAGERDDAGFTDLQLRGAIEVAPGVLRGGTRALKGHLVPPATATATGGTFKLEAAGAPP